MPSAEISLKDLPLNTPFPFEKECAKIVLVRTAEGVYAFEDVCPHAFWPLSAGAFHDGILECPGHAWEFDVQTGKCQDSPAYCLTPISTTIVGEIVRLEWEAANMVQAGNRTLRPQRQDAAANKSDEGKVPQFYG